MLARILVVDASELNVKLLVEWLEQESYVVSTAADGFEALAKIEAERPDIVLLDVMMPGLDGFETCRRIKADPAIAHIPVVIVTALDDVDDLVKGFEAGADDYLTKPFNGLELLARVRLQLRRKQHYEQSLLDPLTGAFNRRYFDAHARKVAHRPRTAQRRLDIGKNKVAPYAGEIRDRCGTLRTAIGWPGCLPRSGHRRSQRSDGRQNCCAAQMHGCPPLCRAQGSALRRPCAG